MDCPPKSHRMENISSSSSTFSLFCRSFSTLVAILSGISSLMCLWLDCESVIDVSELSLLVLP